MRFLTYSLRPLLAICACALLLLTNIAHADSDSRKIGQAVSGPGNIIYLAAAVGLPLLQDGADGKNHALRAADSILTATLITEGLKAIVREKRPDTNEHNSFPSGHATAAFAAAAMESSFHPKQAVYWYLGATAISASRVTLHRHYIHDVIAGALIGYATARWEISMPHGLLLAPLIGRDKKTGPGLQFSTSF